MDSSHSSIENKILSGLTEADFLLLQPHLEWTELELRQNLHLPNKPMPYAYFPTSGICSVIAETAGKVKSETGIIGREGFLGSSIVLYAGSSPLHALVQLPGRALRIKAKDLQQAMTKSPTLLAALLRFIHVFIIQTSQTSVANSHYTIPQRLARWLLMSHDRVDGNEFLMTHEFLSVMLAVRRAGVTDALSELEGKKTIRAMRGRIVILDRTALKQIAGDCYGIAEAEYERLIRQARE
jgi:CRP-like cAMP-binding protein